MKKLIVFIGLLFAAQIASAGEIKKIIDANGRIMYTNMASGYQGRIIKRFDMAGITHYKNLPTYKSFSSFTNYKNPIYGRMSRPSLSGHLVKTGLNSYRYNYGSSYSTIFHSLSDNYASSNNPNKYKYSNLIADAASKYGLEERLLHAVIQTESGYNPSAVSRTGAVGLMQLMPGTAARYGVFNRNDPVQNIAAGSRYLKDLLNMFNYNLGLAVAAYNAGEGAVMRYNNSIPPYRETQNYVRQVLSLYHRAM